MGNAPIFFDRETKQALVKIADSMDALIEAVNRASVSADQSARRLVQLTWVLVVVTVAIVGLTVWLVHDA